ncbi:MAG: DNA polymerase III subunit gamma/tau [Lachnospiraceae bacterium]|nr:DNA polymerase III subunit gamma/tau [Lachnospiraceae bacterium]
MSYMALYRKWRPDRFEDVKGQDHIVTTLRNQILTGRIGHAYLFCGTRGTGKTTVAKIFAKAVNCEHPVNGSPCGECKSCKTIASGASMNVIEIDAASNSGVDNIREIREEVAYSPAEGEYKVYIIDEAHALSRDAFNALLKTLEEPPSYVIFILATTEAHRILPTILSRCQRYDFKRISVEMIMERLHELMAAEGIEAEEKAVRYIAKSADGAMRDALSLLDQCAAFYFGQKLTYENVLEVLGAVDTGIYSELLRSLMARNIPDALKILENAVLQGRDLRQFVSEFTWYLRNLLLMKATEDVEDLLDISAENQLQLKEEAEAINADTLMRYIRIFSELSDDLRYAVQKRILIEMAIIRICKPNMETDLQSLTDRIHAIEEKLENGTFHVASANDGDDKNEEDEEPAVLQEIPKALTEDIKKIVSNWSGIIMQMPGLIASFLKTAKLTAKEDDKLLIVAADQMACEYLNKESAQNEIQQVFVKTIGKEVNFEVIALKEGADFKHEYVDLGKLIHMEIETED